jgi:hypothetical protein
MMMALMDEVSIREGRPGSPGTSVVLRKFAGRPAFGNEYSTGQGLRTG